MPHDPPTPGATSGAPPGPTLPRATGVLPAGGWETAEARDVVVVEFDERFRRRRRYVASGGTAFLLDLPQARVLRDGDGLLLDDGAVIAVRAAPEPLLEVTAASPALLLRLAWHLGNRHLPARLDDGRILIRDDHVIAAMLRGLGATLRAVSAPFDPEGGAYDGHGGPGQGGSGHRHAHAGDHEHPPA